MRKLSILAIMIFCSFFIVSCGTNENNSSKNETSSASTSTGGKIYFLSSSEEENQPKANWVTGEANPDALEEKEIVKPAATNKNTNTKADNNSSNNTDNTDNIQTIPTVPNNNTPINVQKPTAPTINNITPEAYYPKDESADPNNIIADPYDDANNQEETDNKTSAADEPYDN